MSSKDAMSETRERPVLSDAIEVEDTCPCCGTFNPISGAREQGFEFVDVRQKVH